jgi:Serine aminopeptidase, S33
MTAQQAPNWRESAFAFGVDNGLVGVASVPNDTPAHGLGVILLNAGLVHRVGPFRLYVELARNLATLGLPVLRFDQRDLGDSLPSVAASSPQMQLRADCSDALTVLAQRSGCKRFVLIGICSGADGSFAYAQHDARVAGIVLLDGVAWRTRGYYWRHLPPRLFNPLKWLSWAKRKLHGGNIGNVDFRDFPKPGAVLGQLRTLLERGVHALFIYTGGVRDYFNHDGQFHENFAELATHAAVDFEYWPDCDHTYLLRAHKTRLIARIAGWVNKEF